MVIGHLACRADLSRCSFNESGSLLAHAESIFNIQFSIILPFSKQIRSYPDQIGALLKRYFVGIGHPH